ncbi:hypothetical protein DFH06DRAFT_1212825 [Mycena polygramma]|nr:hypothetical protein DFH06DRAFT_1212825 [Mycena polygramma]
MNLKISKSFTLVLVQQQMTHHFKVLVLPAGGVLEDLSHNLRSHPALCSAPSACEVGPDRDVSVGASGGESLRGLCSRCHFARSSCQRALSSCHLDNHCVGGRAVMCSSSIHPSALTSIHPSVPKSALCSSESFSICWSFCSGRLWRHDSEGLPDIVRGGVVGVSDL